MFEKQVEIEKCMLLNEMLDGQEKEIAKDNIEVIAYKGMEMYGYYRMICTNCYDADNTRDNNIPLLPSVSLDPSCCCIYHSERIR